MTERPAPIDQLACPPNHSLVKKCSVLTVEHEKSSEPNQSPKRKTSIIVNETMNTNEAITSLSTASLTDYSDLELFEANPSPCPEIEHTDKSDSSIVEHCASILPPLPLAEPLPTLLNYSPESPRREDCTSSLEYDPPIIPLTTAHSVSSSPTKTATSTKNIVDSIILDYNQNTRNMIMVDLTKPSRVPAIISLVAKLQHIITEYLICNEWTSVQVDMCTSKMLHLTQRPKYLAQALIDSIKMIRDEPICTDYTPPAPAMRPSDQRFLILILRITKHMPSFDKFLKIEFEMQIFKLKDTLQMESLISLMHFYIIFIDIDVDKHQTSSNIRLLMYKCMYYFKKLQPLFIYHILLNNPMALPSAQESENHVDPLIRAFATVLSNDTYNLELDPIFKKQHLFRFLKIRYGYFAIISFSYDQTVTYCIDCININQLKNVDYSLILIGKRKGWEWAIKSIIEAHLLPLLNKFMSNVISGNHDQQISIILFVLASILKTAPCEYNINNYLDLLASVLNASNRKIIQESAIAALCQLTRFGVKQVYSRISKWQPDYEISDDVMAAITTFVHRKPKVFWFKQ